MLRVLMVLEDYGELMFLQTVLKKIGFDVDAIQNPRGFQDSLLRMNPDVLVMTANGKRVHGLDLNKNIRRQRGFPRTILLHAAGASPEPDEQVAGWLPSPVAAPELLNLISDLCGLNKQLVQDKFQKLQLKEIEQATRQLRPIAESGPALERSAGEEEASPAAGSSTLRNSTMTDHERQQRYKKFLNEPPPVQAGFTVRDVQDKVRELRNQEQPQDLDALERERRAFVEHLFKAKRRGGSST